MIWEHFLFYFFYTPSACYRTRYRSFRSRQRVDKALLIILSLLTDKQACLSEAQKKSPWHRRPLVKALFFLLNNSGQRLFFAASAFVSHLFCPSESNTNFIVHRSCLHYTWCIYMYFSLCPKYFYSATIIWIIFMFLHLIFILFTVFLCYICHNITHSYDKFPPDTLLTSHDIRL